MPPQVETDNPLLQLGTAAVPNGASTPAVATAASADDNPLAALGTPATPNTSSTSTDTDQPGPISRGIEGVKQFAKPIMDLMRPAETPTELVLHHASGGTGAALAAYRIAKGVVDSADNLIKSGPAKFQQAKDDFAQTVDDFHNQKYRDMVVDALNSAQDVSPAFVPGGVSAREETEGLRKGGNFVTPFVRDALTAGTVLATGVKNPFSEAAAAERAAAEGATADTAAIADKAAPIESKLAQSVGKVRGDTGLPAGRVATSPEEAAKIFQDQQTAAGQQAQTDLQTGIRDVWNKVADENGVGRPAANASIRDAGQQVGDNIIAQAKAIIKPLDDATGGKFSENDAALRDVNMKLQRTTSLDDEDKLISQKQQLLWAQDDLLKQAKAAGVPDDTLSTFKSKYRTGQAIYDQNQHIRMTTTGLPAGVPGAEANPEVVKSGNLMNRLVKDYSPEEGGKPGRLVQGVGEENAQTLLSHTSQARVAENQLAAAEVKTNPSFEGLPATDQNALRALIRPHVTAGKFLGTNVDFKGVLDDFDKLTEAERKAQFSDPQAVRASLRRQATLHNVKVGAGVAAGAAVPIIGGIEHYAH